MRLDILLFLSFFIASLVERAVSESTFSKLLYHYFLEKLWLYTIRDVGTPPLPLTRCTINGLVSGEYIKRKDIEAQ